MPMNAQRRGEERDVEWKAPLGTTWGESRSSAATQRAVMIRKSLKRIVGIGQLLIGYSQETKPTPPLPPSFPISQAPFHLVRLPCQPALDSLSFSPPILST